MNEITRSSRVTTALQVIQRMNAGLSAKEACSEVGMPRSTYYYIIARDTEAISQNTYRGELVRIISARKATSAEGAVYESERT